MTIRIFNPDHDLALAANQKRFTAPHAGRKLRSDLSFFPVIWSKDGDIVIVEDIDAAEMSYHKLRINNKPKIEFCTIEQLPHILKSYDSGKIPNEDVQIDVWGWNSAICFQLEKNGVPKSLLPTDEQLLRLRELSSREYSSFILAEIRKKFAENNERLFSVLRSLAPEYIFLTGDLKYHDFQRAEKELQLVDIGHYESEQFAKELISCAISFSFSKTPLSQTLRISKSLNT